MARSDKKVPEETEEMVREHEQIEGLLDEYDQAAACHDSDALRRISQEIAGRCLAAGAEDLVSIAQRVKSKHDGDRSS